MLAVVDLDDIAQAMDRARSVIPAACEAHARQLLRTAIALISPSCVAGMD